MCAANVIRCYYIFTYIALVVQRLHVVGVMMSTFEFFMRINILMCTQEFCSIYYTGTNYYYY